MKDKTVWEYMEAKLRECGDGHPALRYFGKEVKRSELISNVNKWARTFFGMGVEADEHILFFTPFTPEIASMIFALNKIGACPVFLNIEDSAEELAKHTKGFRFAVVLDKVEDKIAHILRNSPSFQTVIYVEVATCMPFPLRNVLKAVGWWKRNQLFSSVTNYISTSQALSRWSDCQGCADVAFKPRRHAFITSSSGTSKSNTSKLIIATNESVLAMFRQVERVPALLERYTPGNLCLIQIPPFISTCLFVLFLAPLSRGCTCVLEPRFNIYKTKDYIIDNKASITLVVGRIWMLICKQLEQDLNKGKKPDLSHLRFAIMGGDGVAPKELEWINEVLKKCGSPVPVSVGYGVSEVFSVLAVEDSADKADYVTGNSLPVIPVGVPLPGVDVSIRDENGDELPYGERGELCVKTATLMEGYLHQEELTRYVLRGGWYNTGDLCEMDESGHIYYYCRMSDNFIYNGKRIYTIDLDIALRSHPDVQNAIVAVKQSVDGTVRLCAHIYPEQKKKIVDDELVKELDDIISKVLPKGLSAEGYKVHYDSILVTPIGKSSRQLYNEML